MHNYIFIQYRFQLFITVFLFASISSISQQHVSENKEIDFVSDTQQPLAIEKIWLKANHNTKATAMIFSDILKNNPQAVYMLGDITGIGSSNRKWKAADKFIDSCRNEKTGVHALLGNHDVMWCRKKGEKNFSKRFPEDDMLDYLSITDSIAIVMLNSNFKKLSGDEIKKQSAWYVSTLQKLDSDTAVKTIIVSCHHAPYSNSLIVGSSKAVQQYFVTDFLKTPKCKLFITGHAHAFEHFNISGKDFFTIGGGGGLHQPLDTSANKITDLASDYKPMFHYLSMQRSGNELLLTSHFLKNDFSGFEEGYSFNIRIDK
jgi:UDP-2,3-diacylglucosamine pyrophosphatase LpxH